MKKQKYEDDSLSLNHCASRQEQRSDEGGTGGDVATPFGIVSVETRGVNYFNFPLARLDFAYKNRLYIRTWYHKFTEKGIVRLAGKFAKEIVEKK